MIANYVDLFDWDAIIMELEQSYDISDEDLQEEFLLFVEDKLSQPSKEDRRKHAEEMGWDEEEMDLEEFEDYDS